MSQDNNTLLRGRSDQANPSANKRTILGISFSGCHWQRRFETWASPLSDTADQKCQNAENAISSAIAADAALSSKNLRVFAQGSYKANTNVRDDSDIDICVCNRDAFYYELPLGATLDSAGIQPGGVSFSLFKNTVGNSLYNRFGYSQITRGNKAYNVQANTFRIHADVVPAFEYRKYYWHGATLAYISGVCFYTDTGECIINWPDQTLANGREKNETTGRRYKKVVRVLKGLRYEMEEKGYTSAKLVSSFQIACLAYNIDNFFYGNNELYDDVKKVANQIWYNLYDRSRCKGWKEIDRIKSLVTDDQKRIAAADFFWDLMNYAAMTEP